MAEPMRLIDDFLDDGLDDEQMARLDAALNSDPVFARAFAERIVMERHLVDRLTYEGGEAEGPVIGSIGTERGHWAVFAAAAVFAVGAVVVTIVTLMLGAGGSDPDDADALAGSPVAVMLDAVGTVWDSEPLAPGDSVSSQTLRLESGRIVMNANSGATIAVQGPAAVALTSDTTLRLDRGRVAIHAPGAAAGFTVRCPGGWTVTDLGTAFEILAGDDGSLRVLVTEGRVRLDGPDGRSADLPAGEGRIVDAAGNLAGPEADPWLRWRLGVERLRRMNGLAALYTFEPDAHQIVDLHGATRRPGRFDGSVLALPGDGAHARIAGLGIRGSFTVCAWVRPDRLPAPDELAGVLMTDGWSASSVHVQFEGDRLKLNLNPSPEIRSTRPAVPGRWHHVAVTLDADSRRAAVYMDGERVGEGPAGDGDYAIGSATIGAWSGDVLGNLTGISRELVGAIDELALFDRALTPREINDIYGSTVDPRDDGETPQSSHKGNDHEAKE